MIFEDLATPNSVGVSMSKKEVEIVIRLANNRLCSKRTCSLVSLLFLLKEKW